MGVRSLGLMKSRHLAKKKMHSIRASEVTCFYLQLPVRSRVNTVTHLTPSATASLSQDGWEPVANIGQTTDIQFSFPIEYYSRSFHKISGLTSDMPLKYLKAPRRGDTYSQNSVTGEVKLVAFSDIQSVLFFLRVSSTQVGVFHFWWQWAHGRTLWNDWNR